MVKDLGNHRGRCPHRPDNKIILLWFDCAKNLLSMRFSKKEWWAIFLAEYISGTPISDSNKNDEAVFLNVEDALKIDYLTATAKEILKKFNMRDGFLLSVFYPNGMEKSDSYHNDVETSDYFLYY